MEDYQRRYERAHKKVKAIKAFHKHVKAFVLVVVFLILLRSNVIDFLLNNGEAKDVNFISWVNWNFFITPLLWGIVLTVHGLYVYQDKLGFLKRWEEKQLQKYMDEDEVKIDKYQ